MSIWILIYFILKQLSFDNEIIGIIIIYIKQKTSN